MKHPAASLLTAAAALLLATLPTPALAATMILHSFTGGAGDGSGPIESLTLSDSTLYGMTYSGGGSGRGTLFSMNTDGSGYGLLHTFKGGVSDGIGPRGTLTLSGSKLYGMTVGGGSSSNAGTLFSMNADGTGYGLLHSFIGAPNDGHFPQGTLTLSDSKLYGMTLSGGSSNTGMIFTMNADGTGFSLLHSFIGGANDGIDPYGKLTLSGSKLYGMTVRGGSGGTNDLGTLFSVNTDGTGFSLLHRFTGGDNDGKDPYGSLTLSGSKLYGLTSFGGPSDLGTLFSMNTDGTGFGLLHSFFGDFGGVHDGAKPLGSLTLSGSTLYGMTYQGGSHNKGAIFSVGTDGSGFNRLESFGGAFTDGANPHGDLSISSDGSTLYGITEFGGTADKGVVFARTLTPAPEPGPFALLGLGALFLTARRRDVAA